MLSDFLKQHREEITTICKKKVLADSESKPTSALLDKGLPIFYDELIGVLERTATASDSVSDSKTFHISNRVKEGDAAAHGQESLRLGYSISQVVHSYGAICQSITQFVEEKSFHIMPREFRDLNYSLDCAIAEAVTEFEDRQTEMLAKNEIERMHFLVHEIKNALVAATISYEMIKRGKVGSSGATSEGLTRALDRMKRLLNGVVEEMRLGGTTVAKETQFPLIDLINRVAATAKIEGESKKINLKLDADPTILLTADHDMIFTALLNLLNNAMKFTKEYGNICVRGKESGEHILIEVEDECGGTLGDNTEKLFTPFTQQGADKGGMGLGLSISRRVIELNKGKLTARNIPGKGCVFTIKLPK